MQMIECAHPDEVDPGIYPQVQHSQSGKQDQFHLLTPAAAHGLAHQVQHSLVAVEADLRCYLGVEGQQVAEHTEGELVELESTGAGGRRRMHQVQAVRDEVLTGLGGLSLFCLQVADQLQQRNVKLYHIGLTGVGRTCLIFANLHHILGQSPRIIKYAQLDDKIATGLPISIGLSYKIIKQAQHAVHNLQVKLLVVLASNVGPAEGWLWYLFEEEAGYQQKMEARLQAQLGRHQLAKQLQQLVEEFCVSLVTDSLGTLLFLFLINSQQSIDGAIFPLLFGIFITVVIFISIIVPSQAFILVLQHLLICPHPVNNVLAHPPQDLANAHGQQFATSPFSADSTPTLYFLPAIGHHFGQFLQFFPYCLVIPLADALKHLPDYASHHGDHVIDLTGVVLPQVLSKIRVSLLGERVGAPDQ